MNKILSALLDLAFDAYVEPLVQAIRARVAVYYIEAVRTARTIFITLALLVFFVTLMAAGAVLVPIALCMFMPWEPQTKAIVAASFGAVYVLVPVIAISILMSEKRWLKITKADKLAGELLKRD